MRVAQISYLSYAGGVLPPLVERFPAFATGIMHSEIDLSRRVMKETLERQFYFDLGRLSISGSDSRALEICGAGEAVIWK